MTVAILVYPFRLFFVIVIADLGLGILLPQMLSYSILLCVITYFQLIHSGCLSMAVISSVSTV